MADEEFLAVSGGDAIAMPCRSFVDPEDGRLHFSRLKKIDKSAQHYALDVGRDDASRRKGSALHSYLLGDAGKVCVYRDGRRDERTKKYQAFMADNPGKLILSPSEALPVEQMRAAIEEHPLAMRLLDGIRENTIDWIVGGYKARGTPDVVHLDGLPGDHRPGYRIGVELKSDRCTHPRALMWHARQLHYHAQCSWYDHALACTMAYPPQACDEWWIVGVENVEPFNVTVLQVMPSMLKRGKKLWRGWLETVRACERSGVWPGYVSGPVQWEDDEGDYGDGLDWDREGDEEAA